MYNQSAACASVHTDVSISMQTNAVADVHQSKAWFYDSVATKCIILSVSLHHDHIEKAAQRLEMKTKSSTTLKKPKWEDLFKLVRSFLFN